MTKTKKIFDLFLIFLSLALVLPLYLLITLLVLVYLLDNRNIYETFFLKKC